MKEIRTATFAGREYRFVFHDVDAIRATPGVDKLAGIAAHPEGASNATWWTFEDEAEVRARHWHLTSDDVVLDLGPAFGSYALTAAVQGARVYAVEPCEFSLAILRENIAANEPDVRDRIVVVPLGVHERPGLFDPDAGRLLDLDEQPAPGQQTLAVTSVDQVCELYGIGRVTMMKLDVEGAEVGALRGAEQTIRANRPRILIEEHRFKDATLGPRCEEMLRSWGYGPPVRVAHGSVDHAYYEMGAK